MNLRVSPYLLLTLTNLFWAGNWIVGRGMRDEVPPVALSFWRWVIALACLLPLAWPYLKRDRAILLAGWRWLLLFGILGTCLYNALTYIGLQQTEAINGLLLNSFIPIVIVLLAWLFQGKRLRRIETVGIVMSFIGVVAIVARGDLSTLLALSLNIGDIWILLSVFAWATYTLLLPHRPAAHPLAFLFAIALIGVLATLPFYLLEHFTMRQITPSTGAWLTLAYAGIFPAFLGFIFWNKGVEQVGAAQAGLFIHLMPAFGIVLAAVFLDERLMSFHFIGIALIFGGIFLTTLKRRLA
ncbi:MAG: DMT family transporter [Gammaproteobacteria bacterium]|nr:DMT family transporter [Rhodocyclaceae bacterium]MBU3910802.1 DMT family transporter [Gammaproteobacteria bacterium]MBU3988443.1 DMT family transporter [Gammaproteobacteria bacterium]MBU4006256.1 DMT family transporter [Gammaproteobacteria bacterium]MBU4097863.1 DMT family transporter [Gammaproteobacteria bacterium]